MPKGDCIDDGEYWKRVNHPQHHIAAEFEKFKRLMGDGKVIPEYLWTLCAPVMGLPAEQPDKLKPTSLTPQDVQHLAELSKKLDAMAKAKQPAPAPATRKSLEVPAAN